MGRHPNLDLLERGLDAFNAHDLGVLAELFDPALVWHHSGTSTLAGTHRGVEEVFAYFARRDALAGAAYATEVLQSMADDCFVTIFSRSTAERDGRHYEDRFCSVFRVANGKLVEAWTHAADPAKERAFYGG